MEIQSEYVSYLQNFDLRELLRHAAMAAKWTEPPRDALDKLVLGAADLKSLSDVKSIKYIPFDPTFKRTEGTVQLPSGEVFRVTKGAPDIILKLCNMDTKFREDFDAKVTAFGERGIRFGCSQNCERRMENGRHFLLSGPSSSRHEGHDRKGEQVWCCG